MTRPGSGETRAIQPIHRGGIMKTLLRVLVIFTVLSWLASITALARELSFEERVDAQRAIERVYYSHQIGATRPFELAVSSQLIERKVRTYLRQSAALESFWHTSVTAAALKAEAHRISERTRMPDRLLEIYAALDGDALKIQECFVKPLLVERLTRSFFAGDAVAR